MDTRYGVEADRVVYEVLEGEIVAVNLDTGNYYILDDTAATVWQGLVGGATPAEVVGTLARRYPGDRARIEETIPAFVDQLVVEGLLIASDVAPPSGDAIETAASRDRPAASFTPPILHRYTDMATLIQMDPIHDFDETGWPRRPLRQDR